MSDVEFYVGQSGEQKSFKAHRYILGINSAVFHAMFYGSLAEAGDKVWNLWHISYICKYWFQGSRLLEFDDLAVLLCSLLANIFYNELIEIF